MSKKCFDEKHVDLLLIGEKNNIAPVSSNEFLDIQAAIECRLPVKRVCDMIRTYSRYVLIKYFNTFMSDHTFHHGRKHCRYSLQAFSTEKILKCHFKDFKI